jgi:hypothetical protein
MFTIIGDGSVGNVGIGSTDPQAKLDVNGNVIVKSNITYTSPDGTNQIVTRMLDTDTLSFSGDSGQLFSITDSVTGSIFSVNDVSGIPSIEVIDDGTVILAETFGNVGIGTANPSQKLDVEIQTTDTVTGPVANSYPVADFIVGGGGGAKRGLQIGGPTGSVSSPVYLKVSGTGNRFSILDQSDTENFTILDNGNVGIGTASPETKLHIDYMDPSGSNRTSPVTVMTIETDNNNLPYTGFGGSILFKNRAYTSGIVQSAAIRSLINNDSTQNNGGSLVFSTSATVSDSPTDRMVIHYNGNVGIGTANPAAKLHVVGAIYATGDVTAYYSDIRLKNVEGDIEHAIDKVRSINGFYYTGNDTARELGFTKEEREVGVSAQDVESVLPEAVSSIPGNEEYKTVKYERIVPLLIEAIKEQQTMIDELREEINRLKNG